MPPAVVVQGLAKRYRGVVALDGATWTASAGRVTAVLGPNGAGKTTMVECCEGLRRPDSGEVRVLGTDPWHAAADHRARVGVMLQDGGLPNSARPLPLLRHLRSLYAAPADLEGPEGLVARLGIGAFGATSVRRLSGGQRQRVALAAALVGRPEVAFLDEPSAGLDPHARLDVWDLVREVADAGAAVVLTTHSFEEAERLADHIVVVAAGRVVAEGTLDEVTAGQRLEDRYFALTRKAVA
ncbi:ABC transporter ATP-binding protein [Phycicoccus sp. Soil748]|uniref:ABC transporter ATP-binding protein n=1 Tax=Intrasporangiaceae TaxID=85021 RepID=UPI000703597A|nr:ABC transporter ATP-binding protein [Phycicoccus sp. Soil748]KRE52779.1 ABC transporter ATP-binding protein [Phycicoccus sp. Soil748]